MLPPLETFPSIFYTVLITSRNLEYILFGCYQPSNKHFEVQQTCFTDPYDKITALAFTLKLILLCIVKHPV